jgi:hypothetical protein
MRAFLTPRAFLACSIVFYVGATEAAILALHIPDGVRDILQVIVGVLIAKFGTVYDYYFGSSKAEAVS